MVLLLAGFGALVFLLCALPWARTRAEAEEIEMLERMYELEAR